jgi:hypothetical protein
MLLACEFVKRDCCVMKNLQWQWLQSHNLTGVDALAETFMVSTGSFVFHN